MADVLEPAMHHSIIVVDVAGFGARHRTRPDHGAIRHGLYQALQSAFSRSRIGWEDCYREDRGDGALTLVAPQVPKAVLATGDYPGADRAHQEALRTYRDIGDRGGEVEVLNDIGTLYRVRGDLGRSEALHRQALELAREIGSSWDEDHALAGLGRCALAVGNLTDGESGLRQALEIFRQAGAAEGTEVSAEIDILTTARSATQDRDLP